MPLPINPPIKPMLAKVQEQIPRGDEWIYEPKWDGFRTLVYRDGDDVAIRSRNDRPMNRYFPEAEELLLAELPKACVLDGEIIMPGAKGLEFDTLQLRLHPAESRAKKLAAETPTTFVVFDILAAGKKDLTQKPLRDRLAVLEDLFGSVRPAIAREPATQPGPRLYLTPCTDDPDVAADWFDDLEKVGLDGIIAKKLDLPYSPGERVMVKIKHRRTADCVVGGYRAHKHGGVGALLLGLYEGDELHYVGHTSSFSAAGRKELLTMLEPLRNERTFGGDWGPGAASRWSQGKESEWISVEPKLVCEVSYDYVQSGYRFRHAATFIRWRDDKAPEECLFDQVRT